MTESTPPNAPRFCFDEPLAPGAEVELGERITRHVAALRLHAGDALTLFNGTGGEFACTLSYVFRDSARARVHGWNGSERESALDITLAQGLSAGDRMDYALQKATELGVRIIAPVATERSVVRLSDERAERKLAHWRGVVASSCEQCGRNRLPELRPVATLGEFLAGANARSARLLLSPNGTLRLRELAPSAGVTILIGPEGGLTESEEARATRAGFVAVTLGPRVLRTETAPLAAIAAIQAMWGDG